MLVIFHPSFFFIMDFPCSCSILNKLLKTQQDGLWVESTKETLIITSLEPKEEQHQFTCFEPVKICCDNNRDESELFFRCILLQSAAQAKFCQLWHQPGLSTVFPIGMIEDT